METDFTRELHQQLLEATKIVWKMQIALWEGPGLTDEIVSYSRDLTYRAGVIEGQISRWELLNRLTS